MVRVTDAEGAGVQMVWDAACPWVQIHTSDKGVGKPGHRTGLAVEPMTCAPDAFNADRYDYDAGLIVLEPGRRPRHPGASPPSPDATLLRAEKFAPALRAAK